MPRATTSVATSGPAGNRRGSEEVRYEAEPRGNPFALGIGPNPLVGMLYKAEAFRTHSQGQLAGTQNALRVRLTQDGTLVRSRPVGARGWRRPRSEPILYLTGRPRNGDNELHRSRRARTNDQPLPEAPNPANENRERKFETLYAQHPSAASTESGEPMPRYLQIIWGKWEADNIHFYPARVLDLEWDEQEREFLYTIEWATDDRRHGASVFEVHEGTPDDHHLGGGMLNSDWPWTYRDPNPLFWGDRRDELYTELGYELTGEIRALASAAQRAAAAVLGGRANNNHEAGTP